MYDKTTLVCICSTIVKLQTSELRIQNRSATTLCANSTNIVLSYVEHTHKNGQSLSIVGHPLQQWLHGLTFKNAPVSDPCYVVYNIYGFGLLWKLTDRKTVAIYGRPLTFLTHFVQLHNKVSKGCVSALYYMYPQLVSFLFVAILITLSLM